MNTEEQMHQQDLERVKAFRYMDDDFMIACLRDNYESVELILRIVLGQEDLTVHSARVQEPLKNLWGRSVALDVHAVDSTGRHMDIEIQRQDAGAGVKRARYNSSLLDANILKSGEGTEDIPDSYVIFITENDVMKGNLPFYPVERYVSIGEEKVLFGDGSHIIYVNGTYRKNDAIGKLMHDFSCTNPDDMNYEALAGRARYFKQDEEGVAFMCKMMEDMRREAAQEAAEKAAWEAEQKKAKKTAANLIKLGKMTLDEIAEVTELSIDSVKELDTHDMSDRRFKNR